MTINCGKEKKCVSTKEPNPLIVDRGFDDGPEPIEIGKYHVKNFAG